MNRASCLFAAALLAFPLAATGEEDQRTAREKLFREMAVERGGEGASGVEALGTNELIVNGGFEAGQAPGPALGYSGTSGSWSWTTSDGMLNPIWTDPPSHTGTPTPRSGAWCVYFNPFGPSTNTLSQAVTIPSGSTAKLTFWVAVGTLESSSFSTYDTLTVRLKSQGGATLTTLTTFSNLTPTSGFGYAQKSFDVSSYAGQTVRLEFASYNDSTRATIFLLDDVSLVATTTDAPPPPPASSGTWILPSSARVTGQGAFWTTDLVLMNPASQTANVTVKFLGHDGAGAAGPERTYAIPPGATATYADVLASVFGRESDWGPILIRSAVTTLSVQGQTSTPSPTGGSLGQSVPALGAAEMIGNTAKPIVGVRQDASFRTNLVLANPKDTSVTVYVALLRPDGGTAASQVVNLGPYGFSQLSIASGFGVANVVNGSFLVNCTTPGGQVAAYASVIDAATADPRTILAR